MKSLLWLPMTVFVFLGPIFGLTGCADNSERVLTVAPQSESELGFIVAGTTLEEKDKFFNDNKTVKIRSISDEHIIMFEAVNVDYQTLRTNFPYSRIYKNEFIKYANSSLKTETLQSLMQTNLLNVNPTFNLDSCKDQSLKPIAKMTPASSNLNSRRPLEIGAKVQINSNQSQPHAFVGGKLKKAWIIRGPLGTKAPELSFTETLDVELDTMGVYQVFLLVQDDKQNCQFENINLSVTGNTPFNALNNISLVSSLNSNIKNQEYIQKLGLDQAHQVSKGDGILIAVVDSGVNYNHPYLAENIFINQNEIADNGIDDDSNGLIDDVHGWDFVFNDKHPYDDMSHGTHVAGLAAAKVFGVAPNAKILPIKAGNNFGMLDVATTFKAIIYAIKMKADIINLSLGSERPVFKEELELYNMALRSDALIVAAAGNGEPSRRGLYLGIDIDNRSFAPAGLDFENILTVASLNTKDNLAYYSNFGLRKTNVATYGGEDFDLASDQIYDGQLYSTYIENAQGILFYPAHGTSMATPVASGIAALVRSLNPNLSAGQTNRILETAGKVSNSLNRKIKSGRVLTAEAAVNSAVQLSSTLVTN